MKIKLLIMVIFAIIVSVVMYAFELKIFGGNIPPEFILLLGFSILASSALSVMMMLTFFRCNK